VGPRGLELRATKTHRTYRVELDPETVDALTEHRRRAEARIRTEIGTELRSDAFVFSHLADGVEPWLPNWTTKESSPLDALPGLATSACTISVTSWQPRCL
jgi:integrase